MSTRRAVLQFVDPATGVTVEATRTGPLAYARFQRLFRQLPPRPCYTLEVRGPISRAVFPVSRAAVLRLFTLPGVQVRRICPTLPTPTPRSLSHV